METRKNKPPIFIVGLLRSGTTLLRAMLGQHSAIASGLETKWFELDWKGSHDAEFQASIDRLRQFFGLDQAAMQRAVDESRTTLEFLDRFLSAYAASAGKTRWAEKTPASILHLDEIYRQWPDAKVIHSLRDPRDVYASMKESNRYGGVPGFVRMWCDFLGAGEKAKERLHLSPDRFLQVRYESLVTNPERTMRRVTDFVGEPWEPAVARFEGRSEDFDKVLAITGHASTTLKQLKNPLHTERIGNWKNVATEAEVEQIRDGVKSHGLLDLFDMLVQETSTFKPGA